MYKVSIVVPIYNAEKYLEKCLDSIIGQTLKDIQIVLINDGSTDSGEEICKKYLNDERVIYYYKENEGLAAARDDGILRSEGEYIGFVDSDDWLEPDMYERMYNAAKSNNSDVVFCNCIENEDGHIFTPEMTEGPYNRQQILDDILPRTLAYLNDKGEKRTIRWSNCLRIYKKSTLDSFGFRFDRRFRRSQDSQLTYEAMLHSENFYYIASPLYHNRVVGDSLSRGYTKNMWNLYVPLIDRLYNDTREFTERDYSAQMDLRAFFFVCECIDNEFKPLCPNDYETKINKIEEIINDPICDRFIGKLPTEKMNGTLKSYYKAIESKNAVSIFRSNAEKNKEISRKQTRNKLIDAVTESPIIGTLYKKLRH